MPAKHRNTAFSSVLVLFLGGSLALAQESGREGPVLARSGPTSALAQQVRWLDGDHFAAARWDGTLAFFRRPLSDAEHAPVLTAVFPSESRKGLEMLAARDSRWLVTSNDERSLTFWQRPWDSFDGRAVSSRTFGYDPAYGVANSGAFLSVEGREYLVTGHAHGWVLVWAVDLSAQGLALLEAVDVRSPDRIDSPFEAWNVRAVVPWRDGLVVTGSEDGDICVLRLPDGEVLLRRRYNPAARRGINDLALHGDYLVAVSCSVGERDKNTWLYRLDLEGLETLDAVDLKNDGTRDQAFAFDAVFATLGGKPHVFVSTQEGLLWSLALESGRKLRVLGFEELGFAPGAEIGVGSALDYHPGSGRLVAAGLLIFLFAPEGGGAG